MVDFDQLKDFCYSVGVYINRKYPLLSRGQDNQNLMHFACQKGKVDLVKYLLKNGFTANIDEMDNFGWTALYYAVGSKNCEIVRLLLESGANVNIRNKGGTIPIFVACFNGDREMVKLLKDSGSEILVEDRQGKTVFEWAKARNNEHVLDIL